MATYIPQITDYIPQVQGFKPDFNFLNYALSSKGQQYQQGYQQVSGLYGSLLNSPMLRDSDIQRRDDFFKKASEQIQKITETDLSKPENINTAMEIFKPILNDSNIHQDIAWTKNYYNEQSRAEQLRHCIPTKTNPCPEQYWEPGMTDLNYQRQDYSKTSDEEALRTNQARFVPRVDINAMAEPYLKGFKMSSSGIHDMSHGHGFLYDITSENGTQAIAPMYTTIYGELGQDPKVQDMYNVLARNKIRSHVDQLLADPKYGGDRNRAEDDYHSMVISQIQQQQRQEQDRLKNHTNTIQSGIGVLGDNLEKNWPKGVKPNNPIITTGTDLASQLKSLLKSSDNLSGATINPNSMMTSDRKNQREYITKAMADDMMRKDMHNLAYDYAMKTAKTSIKADPYGVMEKKNELTQQNMILAQQGKMDLMRLKAGVPIGKQPGDDFSIIEGASSNAGNNVTIKTSLLQQSEQVRFEEPYSYHMTGLADNVYSKLASYVDHPDKDHTRDFALSQLQQIFGKSINELQANKKPLSEQHISDSKFYNKNKASMFNNIDTKWHDSLFQKAYPDILTDNVEAYQNASYQQKGLTAVLKPIRENNLAIKNYLRSQGDHSGAIVDISGNKLTPDQYYNELRKYGNVSRADTDADYAASEKKFYNTMDKNPSVGGKPLLKSVINPYEGVGGLGSKARRGIINTRSDRDPLTGRYYNQGLQTAIDLNNDLPNHVPFGVSPTAGPNQQSQVFTPDKNKEQYDKYMEVVNEAIKTISDQAKEPGKKHKTADLSEVNPNPVSYADGKSSVHLHITPELFEDINRKVSKTPSKSPLNYNDFKDISIIFDAGKEPPIFDQFKYGPVASSFNKGIPVTVEPVPNADRSMKVTLTRNSNGTIDRKNDYWMVNDKGVLEHRADKVTVNKDPEQAYREANKDLIEAYKYNHHLVPLSPVYQGPIRTSSQYSQTVSEEDTPEDNSEE